MLRRSSFSALCATETPFFVRAGLQFHKEERATYFLAPERKRDRASTKASMARRRGSLLGLHVAFLLLAALPFIAGLTRQPTIRNQRLEALSGLLRIEGKELDLLENAVHRQPSADGHLDYALDECHHQAAAKAMRFKAQSLSMISAETMAATAEGEAAAAAKGATTMAGTASSPPAPAQCPDNCKTAWKQLSASYKKYFECSPTCPESLIAQKTKHSEEVDKVRACMRDDGLGLVRYACLLSYGKPIRVQQLRQNLARSPFLTVCIAVHARFSPNPSLALKNCQTVGSCWEAIESEIFRPGSEAADCASAKGANGGDATTPSPGDDAGADTPAAIAASAAAKGKGWFSSNKAPTAAKAK